jgi:hypothetical protein
MKRQKPIGGYFEFEMASGNCYHSSAIGLNSGRNALEFVLKALKIKKLYLAYFSCEVVLEPVNKLEIPYEFYCIDENLEPIFDFTKLIDGDAFIYTNYFGLKDLFVKNISVKCDHLIIDNAQAFFSKPINSIPTIYSPRKFFGVPDGGYLYCDKNTDEIYNQGHSFGLFSHLLKRIDTSVEDGYFDFLLNEKSISNQPIERMSKLTSSILDSINYVEVAKRRIANYLFLDNLLNGKNKLNLKLDTSSVPHSFPFWTEDSKLRQILLDNKIYTPKYWPNVIEWAPKGSLESRLCNEVVYLPIDQRYGIKEMNEMLKIILNK